MTCFGTRSCFRTLKRRSYYLNISILTEDCSRNLCWNCLSAYAAPGLSLGGTTKIIVSKFALKSSKNFEIT